MLIFRRINKHIIIHNYYLNYLPTKDRKNSLAGLIWFVIKLNEIITFKGNVFHAF